MQNIVTSLDISTRIGTVPKDYYLQRSPYGSNDSVLTFLTEDLLPKVGASFLVSKIDRR